MIRWNYVTSTELQTQCHTNNTGITNAKEDLHRTMKYEDKGSMSVQQLVLIFLTSQSLAKHQHPQKSAVIFILILYLHL